MSAAGPNTKLSPAPKPPDALTGSRRPPTTTSSPNGKGDREAQHQKKKAKAVGEDGTSTLHQNLNSPSDTPMPEAGIPGFRKKEDYEAAISGGPWTLGDTYLPIWATDPCMPMQKSTRDHF
ncbi:unnamed protein product [Linum trigynum]|uniref:Uncharacterized protein n=1 Tax=Linum trigynum TaxID=586398 RepID=A0AAV2EBD8_9ROSI